MLTPPLSIYSCFDSISVRTLDSEQELYDLHVIDSRKSKITDGHAESRDSDLYIIIFDMISSPVMSKLDIILNDGDQIPWLGFDTGTALYHQDATQSVFQAIEAGVTHLDGAQMYKNEDTLVKVSKLQESRARRCSSQPSWTS